MAELKGIVKVGVKGSEIKFNGIKMYRALSNNDVSKMIDKDTSFVVFERAGRDDMDFISSLSSYNVPIYFYKCSEDYTENNYSTLKDLQREISFKIGHNVRTYKKGVKEEEEREQERIKQEKLKQEQLEREERERQEQLKAEEEQAKGVDDLAGLFDDNSEQTSEEHTSKQVSEVVEKNDTNIDECTFNLEPDNTEDEEIVLQDPGITYSYDKDEKETENELTEALQSSVDNRDKIEEAEEAREVEELNSNKTTYRDLDEQENEVFNWADTEKSEDTTEQLNDSEAVKELREELTVKEKRLDILEVRIENLVKIKDSLSEKVNFYEGLIKKIEAQDSVLDVQTKDSEETLAKLEEYKLTIKSLDSKILELQKELTQIDELQVVINDKDTEIQKLKDDLVEARTDDKYRELQSRLEHEVEIRGQITLLLTNVASGLHDISTEYRELQDKYKNTTSEYASLQDKFNSLNKEYTDFKDDASMKLRKRAERERMLNQNLEEYNKKLIQTGNDLRKADKEKEEALNAKLKAELDKNNMTDTVNDLRSQLKTVKNELEVQTGLKEQAETKLKKFESLNIEKMQEDIKVGDASASQLMQQLGRSKQELQAVTFQLNQRDEVIRRLEDEKSKLEITNKGLSRTATTAERMTIDIDYRGKAAIIAVFGRGGCGTTTAAMSIATRLPGNVLLLDFNCDRPGIDGWVGMNPMIKTLPNLSGMDQSAFGALVKKGTDYVIQYRDQILRKFKERKGGQGVYYFSGIYSPIDLSEFASIDFNQFLNFFGNEFNYIVVDLGTLGGSECQNSLIRSFNKISWRNVMVCFHDKYDLRVMRLKSAEHQIMYTKTIWLLNMAKNTKLDTSMQAALRGMNYQIFIREMDNYGDKKTFYDFGNPDRAKLDEVVEQLIC